MSNLPQNTSSLAHGGEKKSADQVVAEVNALLPESSRPIAGLTPGDLSPRAVSIILEQIPLDQIRDTLQDMLKAERPLKGGGTIPDWRAREAAMKLYLAYKEGLPIQRQQIVTTQVESGPNMLELARTNQYVRDALRNQLDELDTLAAREAGRVIEEGGGNP